MIFHVRMSNYRMSELLDRIFTPFIESMRYRIISMHKDKNENIELIIRDIPALVILKFNEKTNIYSPESRHEIRETSRKWVCHARYHFLA